MDFGSLTSSQMTTRNQQKTDDMSDKQRARHASEESSTSTQSYSNYIPTPPDGGWGWVIVAASLMCNVIVDGIAYSFGVFLLEFVDYFHESKGKTSLVGSLLCGTYLCAGPIVSALTNRYGCRAVTIAGSLLATAAFLLSTLSTSIDMLIMTYGVLGGIGFGMIYLPSIVSVGYYFEKKRAKATGIAVCGSGVGTFIFAPVSTLLLQEYDWKNAMYIVAGVVLNACVCGALMRPLEPTIKPKLKKPREKNFLDRFREQTGIGRKRTESECSTAAYSVTRDPVVIAERVKEAKLARERRVREECGSECSETGTPLLTPNHKPMVIPQLIIEDTKYCDSQMLLGNGSLKGSLESTGLKASIDKKGKVVSSTVPTNKMGSLPLYPNGDSKVDQTALLSPDDAYDDKRPISNGVQSTPNIWVSKKSPRRRTHPRKDSITKEDYSRPMYRKDIFLSGSILNVKEFRSQPDVGSYVKSITEIPHEDFGDENECCLWRMPCLSKSSRDTLKTMLNCSLLKDPSFLLMCIGNIFGMAGFYVPFVYITDRAVLLGIDKSDAAFLVSVIGITNTIGRVLSGFLADLPNMDALLLNNICLFISGIATILSPFCTTYILLVVYAAIFGLCISAYISLTSIILCDRLGLANLTNAFGLLTLARGISSIAGPPIAGAIYDATGSYNVSFYVSGTLITIAGIFHTVLHHPWFKQKSPGYVPPESDAKYEDKELNEVKADGNSEVDQSLSVV